MTERVLIAIYAAAGGMLVGAHIQDWWLRRQSVAILKQAMDLHLKVTDQELRLLQLEQRLLVSCSMAHEETRGGIAAPTSASQGAAPDTAGATRANAGVLETVEPGVTSAGGE